MREGRSRRYASHGRSGGRRRRGQTLTKAAAQTLGLDDAQAEQFVHKFGLTQTKLEGQVFKAIKTLVAWWRTV